MLKNFLTSPTMICLYIVLIIAGFLTIFKAPLASWIGFGVPPVIAGVALVIPKPKTTLVVISIAFVWLILAFCGVWSLIF